MQWMANKQDMEAVLSLWLYALNDVESGIEEKEMIFLFGPSDASYLRDLCWWVGETTIPVQEMMVRTGPAATASEGNAPLDDRSYFGFCGSEYLIINTEASRGVLLTIIFFDREYFSRTALLTAPQAPVAKSRTGFR